MERLTIGKWRIWLAVLMYLKNMQYLGPTAYWSGCGILRRYTLPAEISGEYLMKG